ncbi:MAG: hypothetical protein QNJ47_06280 [Nostocaceae cyanobacterium]|nr:hypothetical protein [Nostocaceae cyanobacterium]
MNIRSTVKPIINSLFSAEVTREEFRGTAIGESPEDAELKAIEWLKREVEIHYKQQEEIGFELVDFNVLQVFRTAIQISAEIADHYYLSEKPGLDDSVGWGPRGLELRGKVRVTSEQFERMFEKYCY